MRRTILLSLTVTLLLLCGTALVFGQSFDGRVATETERFTFIYEPQDAWAVQEILEIADEVYETLAELLDHRPSRPIPVVLSSRPILSNGYYSPFPARIVLFTTSSANRFLGSRVESWIQSLFIHELTHYFHLTSPVGPATYLTPIFGPDVPAMNTVVMPGWWIEGITTYTETKLASGGRGESPLFGLTYEAPLLEGRMWSLAKGSYNSLNPPSGRIYTTGYLMVDHLMRTYGEDAFTQINSSYAWWPFFGMRPAFRSVLDKTPKEVFADALEEKRAERTIPTTDYTRFSRPGTGNYYLPYHTEAGLMGYAFTPESGSHMRLYTMDGDDQELVSFSLAGPQNSTVTADGSVLYITSAWGDQYDQASIPMAPVSYSDFYRYEMETEQLVRLTEKQRLTHPAVSPDGSQLVAIESYEDRWRLVSVDTTTGEISTLYDHEHGNVFEPQFAPDGESIVFIENVHGRSTLVVSDLHGACTRLWEHESVEIRNPRFIDNHHVWYASDRAGTMELYEVALHEGERYRVLTGAIGITGAIPLSDRVLIETYTADGFTLKSVPLHSLTKERIDAGSVPTHDTLERPISTDLHSVPYRDTPRFNLWLPFALNVSELNAGATVISRSPLGLHTLQSSLAWAFQSKLLTGDFTYQYNPGPYLVSLQGELNQQYSSQVSLALRVPLVTKIDPIAIESVHSFWNTRLTNARSIGGGASISWERRKHSRPKDFFGNRFIGTAGGLSFSYDVQAEEMNPIVQWSVRGQETILGSHQVLRLDIDAGASLNGGIVSGLNPLGFTQAAKLGKASALVSARWRIPFGIIDQPIPYGGITAMGLTLFGQTLVHRLYDDSFGWEEQLYLGAQLDANIVIGGSFTLRTSGAVSLRVPDRAFRFSIGLDFATLFASFDPTEHQIEPDY